MSRVKKQITAFSLTLAASLALTAIGASSDSVGKNQTQNMTNLAGMSLVLDQYYSVSKTAEDDILSYLGQSTSELVIKDIINMDSKKKTEPETEAPVIDEEEMTEEETEKEIETETETESETESETETEEEESGETESETEKETETETETEPETEATTAYYFDSIAIADVEEGGYVNVRSGPTTGDEIVGKIYHYCAANILDTVDGEGGKWYRIQSGNVTGYMKASFFITGEQAEELAHSIADYQATVLTDGLRVRQSMDLADDNILTLLYIGSQITVLEQYDEWSKVQVDDDVVGYVYNNNIEVRVIFDTAISLEEEAALEAQRLEAQRVYEEQMRLLAEAQERERQAQEAAALAAYQASVQESESIRLAQEAEAARIAAEQAAAASQAAEQSTAAVEETQPTSEEGSEGSVEETQPQTEPETTPAPETTAPVVVDANTQLRNAAVAYSMQFLGRRYRYGGMDLWGNDGIDCSGFTKRIYENFGIGLEHYSGAQINQGVRVPLDQLLPGDLVFYDTNGTITHVAMYIGNGQIIHAANESYGVCIFDVNYRAPYGACRIIN